MYIDTLPNEADFVFFAEGLPEDGLHRVAIAVEGMDAPTPTMMVTVMLTLQWDDVDRTAGEFRLPGGRRGPRMVPLTTPH